MGAKILGSTVHVHNEDGSFKIYEPGTKGTAALHKAIPNPAAWVDSDGDDDN